jgi:hypothetical protein
MVVFSASASAHLTLKSVNNYSETAQFVVYLSAHIAHSSYLSEAPREDVEGSPDWWDD